MLNAHPELNNPGEVDFLTDHIRPAPDAPTGWRYDLDALRADRMFRAQQIEIPDGMDGLDLTHALLQRLAGKKARGLLCVSMHRDLPLAVELLPGARVVHLLRDPRDVARSSVEMGWAGNLYHGCDHWVRSELDWDITLSRLDPKDWVELRFEALMDAPEAELSRICDFLGGALFRQDAQLPRAFDLRGPQSGCRQPVDASLRAAGHRGFGKQDRHSDGSPRLPAQRAAKIRARTHSARTACLAPQGGHVGLWDAQLRRIGVFSVRGLRASCA